MKLPSRDFESRASAIPPLRRVATCAMTRLAVRKRSGGAWLLLFPKNASIFRGTQSCALVVSSDGYILTQKDAFDKRFCYFSHFLF